MGSISVYVCDENFMSTVDLGCFYTDLSFIWRMPNHELYRQWVALTDPTGVNQGVRAT